MSKNKCYLYLSFELFKESLEANKDTLKRKYINSLKAFLAVSVFN